MCVHFLIHAVNVSYLFQFLLTAFVHNVNIILSN